MHRLDAYLRYSGALPTRHRRRRYGHQPRHLQQPRSSNQPGRALQDQTTLLPTPVRHSKRRPWGTRRDLDHSEDRTAQVHQPAHRGSQNAQTRVFAGKGHAQKMSRLQISNGANRPGDHLTAQWRATTTKPSIKVGTNRRHHLYNS